MVVGEIPVELLKLNKVKSLLKYQLIHQELHKVNSREEESVETCLYG